MVDLQKFYSCVLYRNWDSKSVYKNLSESLVREQHPDWSSQQITEEAQRQFEQAARYLEYIAENKSKLFSFDLVLNIIRCINQAIVIKL